MPSITGFVEGASTAFEGKTKKSKPFKIFAFTVNGVEVKAPSWKTEHTGILFDAKNTGVPVTVTYETDDFGGNEIQSAVENPGAIDLAAQEQQTRLEAPVSASNGTQATKTTQTSKDIQIARSVALKAAVDSVSFTDYENHSAWLEDVQKVAEAFTAWLLDAPAPAVAEDIPFEVGNPETLLPRGF